jgi:hypothetical protein
MQAAGFVGVLESGCETERRTTMRLFAGVGCDGLRLKPAELGEVAARVPSLFNRDDSVCALCCSDEEEIFPPASRLDNGWRL